MNSGLSCNTVKDLLPIYLDGIASEETNIYVKKHLSECELCLSESKKLCQITERDGEVIMGEATSIKTLQKKLITWFITAIILGILLISIAMFCSYSKLMYTYPKNFKLISLLPGYIGIYFLPLLGILVAVIWKKTIPEKEDAFWPNVIISFLAIWIVIQAVFLLWHFFLVMRFFINQ